LEFKSPREGEFTFRLQGDRFQKFYSSTPFNLMVGDIIVDLKNLSTGKIIMDFNSVYV